MDLYELTEFFLNDENRGELNTYAYALLGNQDDAHDLMGKLFVEAYGNPKAQGARNPMAYFKTVLKNKARNEKKRSQRILLYSPDALLLEIADMPDHSETEREFEERLVRQEWIRRLQQNYRPELANAFLRCYVDGWSVKELALELGLSENTLTQQFYRMRKKLKSELAAPAQQHGSELDKITQ